MPQPMGNPHLPSVKRGVRTLNRALNRTLGSTFGPVLHPGLRPAVKSAFTPALGPVGLANRAYQEFWALGRIARAGALGGLPVRRLAALATAMRDYGPIGAALPMAAVRHGNRIAVIDERGGISFAELEARSNAIANAWHRRGLRAGDGVAILARNHRWFVEALFAAAKSGVRIVLLNTDFGAEQLRTVLEREGAELLVHDDEYTSQVDGLDLRLGTMTAWTDDPADSDLEAMIRGGDPTPPPKPGGPSKLVILTSGTTGAPKGAPRAEPRSIVPAASMLSRVPLRAGEVTECCVPLFHSLGFGHLMLAILLGSTLVVRRRFDPATAIDSVAEHRASAMVVVPVMLRRILYLEPTSWSGKNLSSLRIIFVAGSNLGASLARITLDTFGPVLYNMYGSTEVAFATMAGPSDLMVEPGCVGRVMPGAVVKLFDDRGRPVPTGQTGRIFVGNDIPFDGYTGGGTKECIDGLMASGDVGHFDRTGRLFIDGRDDDMIVSGGENVFPGEVEETIAEHPDVLEAAVIGVPDDNYGQRLRAFVVLRPGARLIAQQIKDHVRHHLARFKVPRDVVFVDELPRNPTGKVVKRLLGSAEGTDL